MELAIEEPAPDPGAPACRVCHVSLREFVAPQSSRSGDAQLFRNLCYFRGSEGPSIDPEKEEERLRHQKEDFHNSDLWWVFAMF